MSDGRESPVTGCGAAVRALLQRYAAEPAGRAELHVVADDDGGEMIDLVPRNPRAAPVTVEHYPTSDGAEVCIGFAHGAPSPVAVAGDRLSWIDDAIASVVAGRLVVHEGPGRRRIELTMPDGETCLLSEIDVPLGCLPLPGWRRRARVTRFEPY